MDLNLLIALDALLEENSVLAAAERLHLSPPAVSRTLARIREATGDDILVRSGRTMTPTPYAIAIREEVRELKRMAEALLKPPRKLELNSLERVFTVRCHDVLIDILATALIRIIAEQAPRVGIRFLAEASGDDADLARGHVDLEIGSSEPARPEIEFETLGVDSLVVAMRTKHPLADAPLTAERFAAAEHLAVSRRGRARGPIDDALSAIGLQRHVSATLPTSAAALTVVARTDAIVVVPRTLCAPMCEAFQLLTHSVPLTLPLSPIIMSWHRRHNSDPAHSWIRMQVSNALIGKLKHGPISAIGGDRV